MLGVSADTPSNPQPRGYPEAPFFPQDNKMEKRKIVRIDSEKCNGCGACVSPCAEGAIELVDGKARVKNEALCDGAGFCIGICPTGALTIEERLASPFDMALVEREKASSAGDASAITCLRCGTRDNGRALFPVRFEGKSLWVCARCIPALIHG